MKHLSLKLEFPQHITVVGLSDWISKVTAFKLEPVAKMYEQAVKLAAEEILENTIRNVRSVDPKYAAQIVEANGRIDGLVAANFFKVIIPEVNKEMDRRQKEDKAKSG